MKRLMTKERMMEYYEVYNSGDHEKAVSIYYTQDVVFESPEVKYAGQENVIKFLVESHRAGVKEILRPIRILVDGDNVAVELEMELEVLEDIPDFHIKPVKKGESIKIGRAAFYKIRDGKIAHVKVYRFMK